MSVCGGCSVMSGCGGCSVIKAGMRGMQGAEQWDCLHSFPNTS